MHLLKCLAATILATSFMVPAPANAEEPHGAQGVFCQSLDGAKAFIESYKGGNPADALKTTKDCESAFLLVTTEERYNVVVNDLGVWRLVKLHVIAERVEGAVVFLDRYQYSAEKISEPVKGSAT